MSKVESGVRAAVCAQDRLAGWPPPCPESRREPQGPLSGGPEAGDTGRQLLPGARRCQMAQGGAREKPLLHLLPKRHRSCHPGVISRLKLATPCRPAWGSAARLQVPGSGPVRPASRCLCGHVDPGSPASPGHQPRRWASQA
ncbi:unnamed protein product [Rangifer tarandus platyrhynchus]|uniref:Uncharacterized protein n=1 Tax=Rangifer tarandus platyrhynchus TaxID=3082113 RepID=A0AC59Z2Y3_RANTA